MLHCYSDILRFFSLCQGSLIIPLWSIADIAGKSQAAACLAYLAASVATDTSVNHLAVTNPYALLSSPQSLYPPYAVAHGFTGRSC